jgi:hypothetical protein
MQQTAPTGWHVKNWGVWGWVETAIKSIGIIAGWVAFANSLSAPDFMLVNNPRLAAMILLLLLALPLIGITFFRIYQREIITIIYTVCSLTAHWGMLFALLRTPDQRGIAIVFGVAFAIGELTKSQFLRTSGYTEGGLKTQNMMLGVYGLAAMYVLFAILMLV